MNAKQLKKARQLLGFTQSELSEKLGWASHVNLSRIENDKHEMEKQTALAIECLLRRANKYDEYLELEN